MSFSGIAEVIELARRNLPDGTWEFAAGADATRSRNREALDRVLFRPRVLVDVSQRSTETSFLGQTISMPVMLAPVGSIALFDTHGAAASARAGSDAGTITFVSVMADPSLEQVAEVAKGPKVLQITPLGGDREWMKATAERAAEAGYIGICLTVDSPAVGAHDRNLKNRFHPHGLHKRANFDGHEPDGSWRDKFTWANVAWLKQNIALPLIVKGITTAEDAELAVENGVDVVYTSNHAGLRVDFAPAGIETLPEVIAKVGGKVPVVVDGGFISGDDVVKAVALGATAVLVGKLQCFGLGAGGPAALTETLGLLREEISDTMALIGVSRISELGPQFVQQASWAPKVPTYW